MASRAIGTRSPSSFFDVCSPGRGHAPPTDDRQRRAGVEVT
jgi:hypothetical protein